MRSSMEMIARRAALDWHMDAGVDWLLNEIPAPMIGLSDDRAVAIKQDSEKYNRVFIQPSTISVPPLGASEARTESVMLAAGAETLDSLKGAIANFDGLGLKTTAANMVFACGNPKAQIMIVAEAPESEDDRTGQIFAGADGQLLDKILASIGLTRDTGADPESSVYISPMLNWRPPGNRSLSAAEIATTLPFIERHIRLVQPQMLVFLGGVVGKTLLGCAEPFSRLRGRWFDYTPVTPEFQNGTIPIPAIVMLAPAVLLQNPAQKRAVWEDTLKILEKKNSLK